VRAEYHDSSQSHELQATYEGQNSSGVIGLYYFDGRAGGTVRNNFFNLSSAPPTARSTPRQGHLRRLELAPDAAVQRQHRPALHRRDQARRGAEPGLRQRQLQRHADRRAANFDKTRSVTNTSPRCRWNTRPATRSSLHDRLARLQERRLQHPRQHAGLPALGRPFEDEKLDSLELGAKMVLDGAGWSSTPLFHNKYKNVQLSVFTSYTQANGQPGFFGDFTNAGKATVNGAELEFLWRPAPPGA
jgi:iron complex outermembrane receptor protein